MKIKGMTLKINIEFMWDINYNVYIGLLRKKEAVKGSLYGCEGVLLFTYH